MPAVDGPFETWSLRDAAFRRLVVDWESDCCRLELRGSLFAGDGGGVWHVLWQELRRVSVTREPSPGSGETVGRHWQVGTHLYVIEMRHGGSVQVEAGSVSLEPGGGG